MGIRDVRFEEPKMLIGGELVDSHSGKTFETRNPATGDHLAEIPRGTETDVERAIRAAREAQSTWYHEYSIRERADMLREVAELLREESEHLGAVDAADSGNPYTAMEGDAKAAAECVDIFAGSALEIKGETIPVSEDTLNYTLEQPYGVVGRIIAYNHPVMFAGSKFAAPLLAGNSVVMKPPEQDSLGVMELGRLIAERDIFPDGVLNIVSGFGDEAGAPLVEHPDVGKVGFTGSVPTGGMIQSQAAENITEVLLELGGKNPCLVYPDADLEAAISGCVNGMNFTWSQGQSCGSTTRLFLHESHYEEGLELLKKEVEGITPGNPLDEDTRMGCLISEDQYDKVMRYIDLGKESEAHLLAGGKHPEGEEFENGYFVEPTVFTDVTMDMAIAREEIFGPVLSVLKWDDEEALIEQANDVDYGLTAAIFTNDISRAHKVAKRIEAGYVWINQAGQHYWGAPFGGWKQSGIGKEEAIDEIFEYTQKKNVNVRL